MMNNAHKANGTDTHRGEDTVPLNMIPSMNATANGSTGHRERGIGNYVSLKLTASGGR